MIVFQDTIAHPFPTGDVLCRLDVICIVRDISDKDDSRVLHQGIVGYSVAADVVAMVNQLLYHILFQASAGLMPEFNRGSEFLYIVIAQSGGKGI